MKEPHKWCCLRVWTLLKWVLESNVWLYQSLRELFPVCIYVILNLAFQLSLSNITRILFVCISANHSPAEHSNQQHSVILLLQAYNSSINKMLLLSNLYLDTILTVTLSSFVPPNEKSSRWSQINLSKGPFTAKTITIKITVTITILVSTSTDNNVLFIISGLQLYCLSL